MTFGAPPPASSPTTLPSAPEPPRLDEDLPSVAPTALISLVGSVLGVIPAFIATARARQLGVRTPRYWLVFASCALASLGLGALLITQLGAVSSGSMVGGEPVASGYSPYAPPGGYPDWNSMPTEEPQGTATAPASSATATASASSMPSPATRPEFPAGTKQCSDTVAVNDVTSCEFAANVATAYLDSERQATVIVAAVSPLTNQEYEMTCVSGALTVCTGGIGAAVYIR